MVADNNIVNIGLMDGRYVVVVTVGLLRAFLPDGVLQGDEVKCWRLPEPVLDANGKPVDYYHSANDNCE